MKKVSIICIILFSCCSVSPQNRIIFNSGYGYYLNNSENSLKIMGDKRYKSYFHFGAAYQGDFFSSKFLFEYSYHMMIKEDVIKFVRTASEFDENGNVIILGTAGTDASMISHNIDLNYVGIISPIFSYGFGPSFVINNRIIKVEPFSTEGEINTKSLYDKLASSGFGINAFIDISFPFSEAENYFFISSKIKFRYTHSIWFDKGLRNLDNYKQEFFVFNLSLGIGYAF